LSKKTPPGSTVKWATRMIGSGTIDSQPFWALGLAQNCPFGDSMRLVVCASVYPKHGGIDPTLPTQMVGRIESPVSV
jgi:hypothetical protein